MMRLAILSLLCAGAWAQTNAVVITVHPSSPGVTIPSDFLGLSFETGSIPNGFPAANPVFQQLVSQLGPGWLRFGGNSVDKTTWMSDLNPKDVDRVMTFARTVGWRVLWGLRLANTTSAADADEADYVLSTARDVVAGLEIGNEPDLFANNKFTPATLPDFLTAWGQFAADIKARQPAAIFTGPADAGSVNTWTTQFAGKYGSQIAVLTQHLYPLGPVGVVPAGAPNEATIANLLGSSVHGAAQSEALALNNLAIAQKPKIVWRMAETNSCYNGGQPGVSDVFASALWGIDYMFTLAGGAAAGVNFHGGGTSAYTPIAVSGSNIAVRPLYYALLLFGAAARGRVVPVDLNGGRINLTAYGVIDADGALRVTIVNKDQSQNASTQISALLGGYTTVSALRLSAPSLTEKTNIMLGGAPVAADGTWAPVLIENPVSMFGFYPVDVPAGSAVVVAFGNGKVGIGNTAGGAATVAPNSMASVYGQNLGFVTRSTPSTNLPTTLAAVTAQITDSMGEVRTAPLIYVSPSQVNLLIPDGTAAGTASVYLAGATGKVQVAPVAPGLFTMGGTEVAAATALRYPNDGSAATPVAVFDCSTGTCRTTTIALDDQSSVYLMLYGTGIRGGSNVTATVGGVALPAAAAPQSQYPGLDQVNIQLPASLKGKGTVDVVVTVDGQTANTVQIAV